MTSARGRRQRLPSRPGVAFILMQALLPIHISNVGVEHRLAPSGAAGAACFGCHLHVERLGGDHDQMLNSCS